ncbi:MAG: VRR-NUC domain-containing protein [Alphaproteobacteria bacterium]
MSEFEDLKLGISPEVRGRDRQGTRVTYQLRNDSDIDQPVIPEEIVLKRFSMKASGMSLCRGTRLFPSLWRAVDMLLTQHQDFYAYAFDTKTGPRRMRKMLNGIKVPLAEEDLTLPEAEMTGRLLYTLGPDRVHALVTRHREPGRAASPGIPDLCLFEFNRLSGVQRRMLFVEVKRPGERLAPHQAQELRFMRSLGLTAGVFRLREVGTGKREARAA